MNSMIIKPDNIAVFFISIQG